ncbi:MAG: mechanosensitive ion channel domain-containing protein [Bacteroidota bacterium]
MRAFIVILLSIAMNLSVSYASVTQDTTKILDTLEVIAPLDSITSDISESVKKDTVASTSEGDKNVNPKEALKIVSIPKIFWSIVFLAVGYLLIRFLSSLLETLAERSTNYRITIKGLIPIAKILGWIFVLFIIIAGVFQPPISTVLAVTASVGIAVGFAAQDILKNVFGGVMILFDRPFLVGDKIDVGGIYGEVVQIGLRSTRIVTADDSLVSIPNSNLMNTSVSNSNTGEANCQVVAEIYLPITIDTQRVRQVAIEAAQVSRFIYLNKPIVVLFFNEIKERRSYLKMRLKAYVSDIRNEFAFKSDMTEIVMRELLKEKLIKPEDLH